MKNEATGKRAYHFNLIDAILILIAVAVIGALFYIYQSDRFSVDRTESRSADIIYEIQVTDALSEFGRLVQIGNTVIDADSGEAIGEVANVISEKVVYEGHAPDGTPVQTVRDDLVNITVTVRAKATVAGNGTFAVGNGLELLVGKSIHFRVPDYTATGSCISLKEATGNG